jgi:hypothetical protein
MSWSLQQILEGLGLRSSNFIEVNESNQFVSSYWSPQQAALELFGLLFVLSLLIIILWLVSGYILAGFKGLLFMLFLLILPGCLSAASLWPELTVIPADYVIGGAGKLSSITGYVVIVFATMSVGWSANTVLTGSFNLGENYRNVFDHFWYLLALSSGLFFVSEGSDKYYQSQIQYEKSVVNKSSRFLIDQLDRYYLTADCKEKNSEACVWSDLAKVSTTDEN